MIDLILELHQYVSTALKNKAAGKFCQCEKPCFVSTRTPLCLNCNLFAAEEKNG